MNMRCSTRPASRATSGLRGGPAISSLPFSPVHSLPLHCSSPALSMLSARMKRCSTNSNEESSGSIKNSAKGRTHDPSLSTPAHLCVSCVVFCGQLGAFSFCARHGVVGDPPLSGHCSPFCCHIHFRTASLPHCARARYCRRTLSTQLSVFRTATRTGKRISSISFHRRARRNRVGHLDRSYG